MSSTGSSDIWLVAVPNEVGPHETWEQLNSAISKFSTNSRFHVPDLKVGKLDDLFFLSDQLADLDRTTEALVRKIAKYFAKILHEQHAQLADNLVVGNKDLHSFVTKFCWDGARYPIKQPVKTIKDNIARQVDQIERNLKLRTADYNSIHEKLAAIDRNSKGSILVRDLSDLVSADDFILGSEYLQTIMVIVPKMFDSDWNENYATYSEFVVPHSSRLIFDEGKYSLYSVTLFKRVISQFKAACKKKFTVRDFVYDKEIREAGRNARDCLLQQRQKCYAPLARWLKVNFGEAFSALIHIKALRVFNESVLRFGLPVSFNAAVLLPKNGYQRRIRLELNELYKHLDSTACGSHGEGLDRFTLKAIGVGDEYFPYVFFKVNMDFLNE